MSTKKVKNATQSGNAAKANKGFGAGTKPILDDKAKAAVEAVAENIKKIDEALEVVASSAAAEIGGQVAQTEKSDLNTTQYDDGSFDQELDVDFSFGKVRRQKADRSARARNYEYGDEPVIYVAGTKRVPESVNGPTGVPGAVRYYRESSNPMEVASTAGQRFSPDTLMTKEKIRWYKLALPEIDVLITQGSELVIDDRISVHCGWEGEEGDWITPPEGKKPILYIIGSIVRCKSIAVGANVTVNNSSIEVAGHLDFIASRITGSRINVRDSIDIYNSGVHTSVYEGINRLTVRNSRWLRDINITGFDNVNMIKVTASGKFRLNNGWSAIPGLGIDIVETHLVDFAADFTNFHKEFAKVHGVDKPWLGNGMKIRRRTDYGYFSGSSPIPFVRCGDFNIATPANLYQATEIDPVSFPKEKKELSYQPQYGFRDTYPAPSLSDDNSYTSTMRGGKFWEKARKDCFPNPNPNPKVGKNPIGAIGENLIQSLIDQVKSRVKLYVELGVISEV